MAWWVGWGGVLGELSILDLISHIILYFTIVKLLFFNLCVSGAKTRSPARVTLV